MYLPRKRIKERVCREKSRVKRCVYRGGEAVLVQLACINLNEPEDRAMMKGEGIVDETKNYVVGKH